MPRGLRIIRTCRACGHKDGLELVLNLGQQPLANALLEHEDDEPDLYPLTVWRCPVCSLVQLGEIIDPAVLFKGYRYMTGVSAACAKHFEDAAADAMARYHIGADSTVIEMGSNDGTFLRPFKASGARVLGIDPAEAPSDEAALQGIPTLRRFFGLDVAEELVAREIKADLFAGSNVLAHVPDLGGLAAGVARILKPDGVAVFEFPWVVNLVEGLEFDTIYHEHQCYFSLWAIELLFARHGLIVERVDRLDIHGGSLRIAFTPSDSGRSHSGGDTLQIRQREIEIGASGGAFYQTFASRVEVLRAVLKTEISRRMACGQRLAAYGAAAKGATLLNYCDIGSEALDFVVDRNPHKQGCWMPGARIPILSPDELLARQPDAVLLLVWNFADEVIQQQAEYLRRGGVFIVPVPKVRIIGKESLR